MNVSGYTSLENPDDTASINESPLMADEPDYAATVGQFKGPQSIQLVDKRESKAYQVPESPKSQYAVVTDEDDISDSSWQVSGAQGEHIGHSAQVETYNEDASPRPIVHSESEQYFQEAAKHLPPGLSEILEQPDEVYGDDYSDIYRPVAVPAHTPGESRDMAPQPGPSNAGVLPYPDDEQGDGLAVEPLPPAMIPGGEDARYALAQEQTFELGDATTNIQSNSGFEMIEPSHAHFHPAERPLTRLGEAVDPDAVYYPAPIPIRLRLPPLLSKRSQAAAARNEPARPHRVKSLVLAHLPPPEWEPSPLGEEITAIRAEDNPDWSYDDVNLSDIDVNSDRATILSDDDDYQNMGDDSFASHNSSAPVKRSWMSNAWNSLIKKQGEVLTEEERENLDSGEFLQNDQEFAFSRFDPEIVEQQTRMLKSGGVYSSVRPADGKVTSLIEELEIRKAGRLAQRSVVHREANEIRAAVGAHNRTAHPLDQIHQPTLLELQQIANMDYNDRKDWHNSALNRDVEERRTESLADRRSRLKALRSVRPAEVPVPIIEQEAVASGVGETLAQRRARIRREKELIRRARSSGNYAESMSEFQGGSVYQPEMNTIRQAEPASTTPQMASKMEEFGTPHSVTSMMHAVATNM